MTRRRALLAWSTAWLLAGIAITCSPPAHADPTGDYLHTHGHIVCQDITEQPDQARVNDIVWAIQYWAGLSRWEASRVVWAAVTGLCPEHVGLLQQTVARNERQMPV